MSKIHTISQPSSHSLTSRWIYEERWGQKAWCWDRWLGSWSHGRLFQKFVYVSGLSRITLARRGTGEADSQSDNVELYFEYLWCSLNIGHILISWLMQSLLAPYRDDQRLGIIEPWQLHLEQRRRAWCWRAWPSCSLAAYFEHIRTSSALVASSSNTTSAPWQP